MNVLLADDPSLCCVELTWEGAEEWGGKIEYLDGHALVVDVVLDEKEWAEGLVLCSFPYLGVTGYSVRPHEIVTREAWTRARGVNHITWEWAGTCDDSGVPDLNGDSDALPRAWWAIGPNGDRGWSVSLVWFIDDTDDQDEVFLTNFPDQRQARMFCMDFQRNFGYRGLTPGQAYDAWCDGTEVTKEAK